MVATENLDVENLSSCIVVSGDRDAGQWYGHDRGPEECDSCLNNRSPEAPVTYDKTSVCEVGSEFSPNRYQTSCTLVLGFAVFGIM